MRNDGAELKREENHDRDSQEAYLQCRNSILVYHWSPETDYEVSRCVKLLTTQEVYKFQISNVKSSVIAHKNNLIKISSRKAVILILMLIKQVELQRQGGAVRHRIAPEIECSPENYSSVSKN